MFNEGISIIGDLIDLAVEDEIIAKSGSWFSYNETRLGQGRENSKLFLAENTELFEEIKAKVLVARGVAKKPESEEASVAVEVGESIEAPLDID